MKKRTSKTQTRVAKNIYRIETSGKYRVRLSITGTKISKTFDKLKDAKSFIAMS